MLHHIFRRILGSFMAPAVQAPRPRQRRLRAVCEFCGKDVAIVASTGRYWKHACTPPETPAHYLRCDNCGEQSETMRYTGYNYCRPCLNQMGAMAAAIEAQR